MSLVFTPSLFPPPLSMIRASIYRQAPGCHPGGKLGDDRVPRVKRTLNARTELVELVLSGRGWVDIEGCLEEITAGALLWHVGGDKTISRSDWDNPYCCLAIPFDSTLPEGVRRVGHLTWWREIEEIQKFADEVVTCSLDSSFDQDLLFRYTYHRLLFQAQRCGQNGSISILPEKLRHAVDLLNIHYAQAVNLTEIAEKVGWSLAHLHHVFRRDLNVTPHQFILERRIKVAKDKLATTDFSVKRIAIDCGFASSAAFCHVFRERVGMTPLNYRRQEKRWMHL